MMRLIKLQVNCIPNTKIIEKIWLNYDGSTRYQHVWYTILNKGRCLYAESYAFFGDFIVFTIGAFPSTKYWDYFIHFKSYYCAMYIVQCKTICSNIGK